MTVSWKTERTETLLLFQVGKPNWIGPKDGGLAKGIRPEDSFLEWGLPSRSYF
jgi:hypothetical protein